VAKPLAEMAKASGQVSRRKDIARADALTAPSAAAERWRQRSEPWNTEAYARIEENRFFNAAVSPVSTFSIDVDAASYSNVRRFLAQGTLPPTDAVRLEELVNYFPYHYPDRAGEHPFGLIADVGPCPWADDHRLVRVALQARRVDTRELPPSNLVFLIDVSGSMQSPDKLPLVQRAFRALVQELRPEDRVAIVVYAGAAGLVLPSTPGTRKGEILDAIDRLEAGGSTAGGAGLRLAYDVAREHFLTEGNNRVILATDGDFNVGVSSDAEMIRLVERRQGNVAREVGENVVVDPDRPAIIRSAVNNAMPDRDRIKSLCFAQPAPCSRQRSWNVRYSFRCVRLIDELAFARAFGSHSRLRPDTVDLPLDQALRVSPAVRTEYLELDARRTGVDDEDRIHWSTPRAWRCCCGARARKGRRLHRRPCVNARSRLAMSV